MKFRPKQEAKDWSALTIEQRREFLRAMHGADGVAVGIEQASDEADRQGTLFDEATTVEVHHART